MIATWHCCIDVRVGTRSSSKYEARNILPDNVTEALVKSHAAGSSIALFLTQAVEFDSKRFSCSNVRIVTDIERSVDSELDQCHDLY